MKRIKRSTAPRALSATITTIVLLASGVTVSACSSGSTSAQEKSVSGVSVQKRSGITTTTDKSPSGGLIAKSGTPSSQTTPSAAKSSSGGSLSGGSSSSSTNKASGGGSGTPYTPPAPPTTTPPVATPPPPSGPCNGASCIIYGDNGVVGALNALRAAHGLPPVTSSSSTSMTQNCALNGNGSPCGNNEAATGVIGNSADGNQAVNNWMSVSSSLLLEPGVSAGGAYNFHVDVGWAWVAGAGHGYVAVISVCANTPNAVVYF